MRAMQAKGSPTPPGSGTGLQAPSVMLTPVPGTRLPLQPGVLGWPRVGEERPPFRTARSTSLQPGRAGPGGSELSTPVPQPRAPSGHRWQTIYTPFLPGPRGLRPIMSCVSVTGTGTDPAPKKLRVDCNEPGLSPHRSHAGDTGDPSHGSQGTPV